MKKESKSAIINLRITPEEKELIKEYCSNHNLTISEWIRQQISRVCYEE